MYSTDDESNPFSSTYNDCEGRISFIGDLIYATKEDQLFVRTIQSNQANLGDSSSFSYVHWSRAVQS